MSLSYTLLLLPHQDDELFITNWLKMGLASGQNYLCYFLTDGNDRRNEESRRYLLGLGFPIENICFLGRELSVADGQLPQRLEFVTQEILKRVHSLTISEIIAPGWEGGHQDHDAAHLLSLSIAHHLKIIEKTWQYYLYNGDGSPGKFFRVMHPLFVTKNTRILRLKLWTAIRTAFACFQYDSQMKTWLGLFPQIFLHYALKRHELLNPVSLSAVQKQPHPGALLYERYARMKYSDFRQFTQSTLLSLEQK